MVVRNAESVEAAQQFVEQQFHEDDNLDWTAIVNLSEGPVRKETVSHLIDRCCGEDEELFVIDGDLWLLAWSYGH